MERGEESDREGERVVAAAARPCEAPASPASASSIRPVVSSLGLSAGSPSSSEQGSSDRHAPQPAAAAQVQRQHVQERLEWVIPKLSRKAKWRQRKSLQRRQQAGAPAARLVSPSMAGRCFKCLRPGHPKRACWNEQVCYRCGKEGHGSGGCKRPRSPESKEELRLQALALVERRLAGRRGFTRPGARVQGAPAARHPGAPDRRAPAACDAPPVAPAPPPPPPPLSPASVGSWEAESAVQRVPVGSATIPAWSPCVVRQTTSMDEMERQLQCSLVVYVGGSRPAVSCDQVADALVHGANIPWGAFTVHKFKPYDFIIVFASPEFKARVAAWASLPFAFFTLFFRQWTRLAQANRVVMCSKVVLEVEGIPPHVWEKDVVQQLIGGAGDDLQGGFELL
ncbi:hypothetical protein QYE76_006096 [Lolium multiflorum]|uniref:CCHC-type domain-containing protein n=1 Tax=Lolium multiflorum TaxID=4521 RepID=A0AAD8RXM8_LOLMU|nr:hypothetical protein QYE76_006096 [Lolium multiflorum]